MEARVSDEDDDSPAWAAICTRVDDRLAMEADTDSFDSHVFNLFSTDCRVAMIRRDGPVRAAVGNGDRVLLSV